MSYYNQVYTIETHYINYLKYYISMHIFKNLPTCWSETPESAEKIKKSNKNEK